MTEETIFTVALEKADPAERAAFLAEACGADPDLRNRVEGLLAAHEKAGDFLECPAVVAVDSGGDVVTRTLHGTPEPETRLTQTHDGSPAPDSDSREVLAFLKPPSRAGSLGRLAHYEVEEVIGHGGFGMVLRAFDEKLRRVVAIKILAPQLATSGTARARFQRAKPAPGRRFAIPTSSASTKSATTTRRSRIS